MSGMHGAILCDQMLVPTEEPAQEAEPATSNGTTLDPLPTPPSEGQTPAHVDGSSTVAEGVRCIGQWMWLCSNNLTGKIKT